MPYWISFDLDFVTGDCQPLIGGLSNCNYGCCINAGPAERPRIADYTDARSRMRAFVAYLKEQSIDRIIVRDSHGEILRFLSPGDSVFDYDYHYDYDLDFHARTSVAPGCWNWINLAQARGIHVTSPCPKPWVPIVGPCSLFIALSFSYTAPTVDDLLFAYLLAARAPVDLYSGQ